MTARGLGLKPQDGGICDGVRQSRTSLTECLTDDLTRGHCMGDVCVFWSVWSVCVCVCVCVCDKRVFQEERKRGLCLTA